MKLRPFLFLRRDGALREVCVDKRLPLGQFFIASIQPEVHGKTHGTTDVIAGYRIVRERIRVVTVIVMAVHIVEQTPDMFASGVIEYQHRVGLGTTDCLRLLEQIRESPVVDALLEPGRLGEEPGEVGFVSTLKHTACDVREAFVVEDNQPCQVILEMVKLASILKKIPKGVRVSAHQGSGSYHWQLHEVLALSPRGWDRAEEYHTDVRNGKIQQPSILFLAFSIVVLHRTV